MFALTDGSRYPDASEASVVLEPVGELLGVGAAESNGAVLVEVAQDHAGEWIGQDVE